MTIKQKLVAKVKQDLGIDICEPSRLYPGYWQRSSGAWSWYAYVIRNGKQTAWCVGSQWSCAELLKGKKLEYDPRTDSIFPD